MAELEEMLLQIPDADVADEFRQAFAREEIVSAADVACLMSCESGASAIVDELVGLFSCTLELEPDCRKITKFIPRSTLCR